MLCSFFRCEKVSLCHAEQTGPKDLSAMSIRVLCLEIFVQNAAELRHHCGASADATKSRDPTTTLPTINKSPLCVTTGKHCETCECIGIELGIRLTCPCSMISPGVGYLTMHEESLRSWMSPPPSCCIHRVLPRGPNSQDHAITKRTKLMSSTSETTPLVLHLLVIFYLSRACIGSCLY